MGLPMLEHLASRHSGRLLAFDVTDAPFAQLAQHPAWGVMLTRATRMTDFAACDAVITMLPDSTVTNRVIVGTDGVPGLIDYLRAGSVVIDMGSSNPADTVRLAATLQERRIGMLDAPVSGAVAKARTGELSIMVGAEPAEMERWRHVLASMGSKLIHTGGVGSAHAMKALNNYVYAAGLLATAEALLIAERMGLDSQVLAAVLNASSGRNVATETKLRQFMISGAFDAGFALRLQAKDLATAAGLQGLAQVEAPQLSLCASLWQDALQALPGARDNTEIYRYLQQRNEG